MYSGDEQYSDEITSGPWTPGFEDNDRAWLEDGMAPQEDAKIAAMLADAGLTTEEAGIHLEVIHHGQA